MRTVPNSLTQSVMSACNGFRMIGVKSILQDDDFVRVNFKGSRKCNLMTIKLNGLDLLDVEFGKLVNKKIPGSVIGARHPVVEVKANHAGIYIDMLREIFEQETGLYLTF